MKINEILKQNSRVTSAGKTIAPEVAHIWHEVQTSQDFLEKLKEVKKQLPLLTNGTEKQNKWATDIRSNALVGILFQVVYQEYRLLVNPDHVPTQHSKNKADERFAQCLRVTNAKWWIENRGKF